MKFEMECLTDYCHHLENRLRILEFKKHLFEITAIIDEIFEFHEKELDEYSIKELKNIKKKAQMMIK